MKHLLKAFLFLLLIASAKISNAGTYCLVKSAAHKGYINIPDTSVTPNYSDLNVFWADFKKYAIDKNYKALAELTAFKFMNQNNMISKDEFLADFSWSAPIKNLRKAGPPKYSKDKHYDYDTNKYLGHSYTAVVNGVLLLFCKIKGKWKFTGVSYGE